jgi:arylsulfatase A-like enzyme
VALRLMPTRSLVLAVALLVGGPAAAGSWEPQRPYETPHIDRLAATGVRFTQAYAAAPVCSPTRASILTGQYPARIPLTDYIPGQRAEKLVPAEYLHQLPLEQVTLAEALREAGYATFFAGKWHLGGEGYLPEDQGFDINKGGTRAGGPWGGGKYFSPYGNPKLEDGPPGEHLPDRLARETVQFIDAHRVQPFFAFLSFYSVHTPLMAPEEIVTKYEAKRDTRPQRTDAQRFGREGRRDVRRIQDLPVYAAMVESMDRAVGQVLDALETRGLSDRTIVIFTSDNGGLSTSEGFPTSNVPLRAGKGWLYEGGIRVPLIVRVGDPALRRAGRTCTVPALTTDLYPTLLELCGLPSRPAQHLDGVSLAPLLRGAGSLRERSLFWHYPHYGNQGGTPGGAVRAGDFKLIEFFEDDRVEMYNLSSDPEERRDLAGQAPNKTAELRGLLRSWRRQVGAHMPKVNPQHDAQAVAAWHEKANEAKAR